MVCFRFGPKLKYSADKFQVCSTLQSIAFAGFLFPSMYNEDITTPGCFLIQLSTCCDERRQVLSILPFSVL